MSYVIPHRKISREATQDDTDKIIGEGAQMFTMCHEPPKYHPTALAIAHAQVDHMDPIRFFVVNDGTLIVNPVITRHTKVTCDKQEGCTTFGRLPFATVQRWNKIEVEYDVIDPETKEWSHKTEAASGQRAQMFQHEIDHMDGKYVYKVNWKAADKKNEDDGVFYPGMDTKDND